MLDVTGAGGGWCSFMSDVHAPSRAWSLAARLLERWRARQERVDALLETLSGDLSRVERARVQALLFGAVRHLGRIDAHLTPLLARPPRTIVWAALQLAGYELIEGGPEGHAARVGHHAVEQTKTLASPKEAGLVNAVVRRLAAALASEQPPEERAAAARLARYYSHPDWLVDRWWAQFGPRTTRALLEWNQSPAPVFARWRRRDRMPGATETEWLRPVPAVEGFYEIASGNWDAVQPLLADGTVHIQDPATRFAVELLAPQAGEDVLDLCAAPGGKSLALADAMGRGRVVSVDVPGPRLARLQENLAQAPKEVTTAVVAGDLLALGARLFAARELPVAFPAVLIDVPCSNTGVMRHRVDVKWRLQPDDFRRHATQQFALLEAAASLVAPGGRLVYSTCSLEAEENERVVDAFVRRSRGAFERVDERISRPWETGYDGAAAFLLRRR
jgi:16S rRNA (cytosine967-C5)-methyltransferase